MKQEFKFEACGDYGIHDGFFNVVVKIDGVEYDLQCCTDEDGGIDFNDCGYNQALCADVNEKLAEKIGWDCVIDLIKQAHKIYESI